MTETAADRQRFLSEILAVLRDARVEAEDPADCGEDLFCETKQRLLDRYEPGSPESRAIATIGWDEIEPRLDA